MFVYPNSGARIQFPFGEVVEDKKNTEKLIRQICSCERLTRGVNQLLETSSWTITSIPLAQVKIDRWANMLFDVWANLPSARVPEVGSGNMATDHASLAEAKGFDLRRKFVEGHRTRIRILITALHLLAHTQQRVLGRDLTYAIVNSEWFTFLQEERESLAHGRSECGYMTRCDNL